MRNKLLALLLLTSTAALAQSPVSNRISSGIDLGMAYSPDRYQPSFYYYQLLNIGQRRIFAIGWTGRLGVFYGDNINYYTAPARLTREKTGFAALNAPLVVQNIDTLRFDLASMTSASVGIRAQLNLGRIEIGGSADLLGLTLGRRRSAWIRSSTGGFADSTATIPFKGANIWQTAKPQSLNVRMLGDNDLGTLCTEVYARLYISKRIALKGGYQWLTSEMRMDRRDVVADNNRFRNRSGMAYLALTFPAFR